MQPLAEEIIAAPATPVHHACRWYGGLAACAARCDGPTIGPDTADRNVKRVRRNWSGSAGPRCSFTTGVEGAGLGGRPQR